MREDIYKKEREIYDVKNQINVLSLKFNTEIENKNILKNQLTNNLDKINDDKHHFKKSITDLANDKKQISSKYKDLEQKH
jgi:predicted  nucleic acid-binding Zn-ribbon protein